MGFQSFISRNFNKLILCEVAKTLIVYLKTGRAFFVKLMKKRTNKAKRLNKVKYLRLVNGTNNVVKRNIGLIENGANSIKSVITPRRKNQSVIIESIRFENCNVVFNNGGIVAIDNAVQKERDEGLLKHLKKVGWAAVSLIATGVIKYLIHTFL